MTDVYRKLRIFSSFLPLNWHCQCLCQPLPWSLPSTNADCRGSMLLLAGSKYLPLFKILYHSLNYQHCQPSLWMVWLELEWVAEQMRQINGDIVITGRGRPLTILLIITREESYHQFISPEKRLTNIVDIGHSLEFDKDYATEEHARWTSGSKTER